MTDLGFSGDEGYPGDDDGDDFDDGYEPATSRRLRRGKKALVALAGLAALAAGGTVLVTEVMPAEIQLGPELAAPAPRRSPGPTRAPKADSPYLAPARTSAHRPKQKSPALVPIKSGAAPQRSPVPFTNPPMSLAQRVVLVRAAGSSGALPLPMPRQLTAADAQDVTVVETGTIMGEGATLRVVSALGDLTGRRELSWVADAGQPVGDGHCSQNFYYGAGRPAGENPALMVCWRTSAVKSVFTVAVSAVGRPSAQSGVLALDRQWALLKTLPMPPF